MRGPADIFISLYLYDPAAHFVRKLSDLHAVEAVVELLAYITYNLVVYDNIGLLHHHLFYEIYEPFFYHRQGLSFSPYEEVFELLVASGYLL